ncbi:MAG TPA: hypothetical protein VJ044_11225 [Candidatus Hodarchaeales archaeon]|nr:hypothetical protein [Candidatus Hodarchaeales archaeon]
MVSFDGTYTFDVWLRPLRRHKNLWEIVWEIAYIPFSQYKDICICFLGRGLVISLLAPFEDQIVFCWLEFPEKWFWVHGRSRIAIGLPYESDSYVLNLEDPNWKFHDDPIGNIAVTCTQS